MTSADLPLRESSLLRHIYDGNVSLPATVTIPPGDDMGAIKVGEEELLITVDQLIDGVHFRLNNTPLDLIGRKAITRNLSDVAAMAALPVAAVAAGALPTSFSQSQANELCDAMRKTAEHYGCPLIGGDIAVHRGPLVLTVTVLAKPSGIRPILRSGAKPGDWIGVTGVLGRAWDGESGGGAHMTFEPRVAIARRLAQWPGIQLNSMMDISDGLAHDLREICRQSKAGAEIFVEKVPLREGATPANALQDGEDYELLFTYTSDEDTVLPSVMDNVPISTIGRITRESSIELVYSTGQRQPMTQEGWDHQAIR